MCSTGAAATRSRMASALSGVRHALCNAHHLRKLKALVEIEKEDWARMIQRLLRRAGHVTNLAREQGMPRKPSLIALIDRCYDGILANGLAFDEGQPVLAKTRRRGRPPRRVGHNLLLRLSTRRLDVLRFLVDPSVPCTNNLAERDGRTRKLRQRSPADFAATIVSRISPSCARFFRPLGKQGWNTLRTAEPAHLIEDIRVA
jgi:transposase